MNRYDTLREVIGIYRLSDTGFIEQLSFVMSDDQAESGFLQETNPQKGSNMPPSYQFFSDIHKEVPEVPADSIVSRTISSEGAVKAILFGFATGQELSQHTASVPAMIQILSGDAQLTLGQEKIEVHAGAWAYMEPNLPHSLYAQTPVTMLLIMLK